MLLQAFTIPNNPYDRKHLQFKITIPKNISKEFNLTNGQTVYLKDNGKKIDIHMLNQEESIPIIISNNCTRIRNGMEYFITRICIPLVIIKNCKLEKQDSFYFTTSQKIITMNFDLILTHLNSRI